MNQKGYIQFLILIFLTLGTLFLALIFLGKFTFKANKGDLLQPSTPTPASTIYFKQFSAHLADNASVPINKIKMVAVVVKPSDFDQTPSDEWQVLAKDWYAEVVSFWQRELDNKAEITFQVYPEILPGKLKVSEYDFNSAYNEVTENLKQQESFRPYLERKTQDFLILFIYILSDEQHFYKPKAAGTHFGNIGATVAGLDWAYNLLRFYSTDSRVQGRGVPAQEAHEMGHTLGLQHSSDDPNIVAKYFDGKSWSSDCDLMIGQSYIRYQKQKFLEDATLLDISCILPEQKQLFFE